MRVGARLQYSCIKIGGKTHIHQAETRHHLLALLRPACRVSSRRAPGVDEELVHVLEGVEAVRAAPAQDVDIELVRLGEEEVGLRGYEREALDETDAQRPVRDDLRQRQGRRLDVVPALHYLQVRRDRPQVLVGVLVCQIA